MIIHLEFVKYKWTVMYLFMTGIERYLFRDSTHQICKEIELDLLTEIVEWARANPEPTWPRLKDTVTS